MQQVPGSYQILFISWLRSMVDFRTAFCHPTFSFTAIHPLVTNQTLHIFPRRSRVAISNPVGVTVRVFLWENSGCIVQLVDSGGGWSDVWWQWRWLEAIRKGDIWDPTLQRLEDVVEGLGKDVVHYNTSHHMSAKFCLEFGCLIASQTQTYKLLLYVLSQILLSNSNLQTIIGWWAGDGQQWSGNFYKDSP